MTHEAPDFRRWVHDNSGIVPLILTGLAFLFVLLHLAIISRFNATTARGLVESAGPGTVIMATFISALFPLLATIFLLIAVLRFVESITGGRHLPTRVVEGGGAVMLGVLFFIPVFALLVVMLSGVAGYVMRASIRRKRKRGRVSKFLAWILDDRIRADHEIAFSAVIIAVLIGTASVWVPAERVTVTNGHQLVAYVLGEEAGWYTLLTEEDRGIMRVLVKEVTNRNVCVTKADDAWRGSMADWVVGGEEPDYPACEAD